MSMFVVVMVGGWGTALAMFGLFALSESGKLLEIRRRLARWLDDSVPAAKESMQAEIE